MYLLIVCLPLLGALSVLFFGRWLGGAGSAFITIQNLFFTTVLAFFIAWEVLFQQSSCFVVLGEWFLLETVVSEWGLLFDSLSSLMLLVVSLVSVLVHLYSVEYMAEDPHLPRFMSYLSLFTFFMLILVTADNYLQMFVGWEGVGLSSYLLINFWFGRLQANKAAIKAMIVNRIGDFGLALAIFGLYRYFGTLNYTEILATVHLYSEHLWLPGFKYFSLLDMIGCFLFLGAVGKSAQIGLHTWLPDAMEGPTPVSALIHAATMVTAGVFLLCRSSSLLLQASTVHLLIVLVGGMTAFLAATTGLLQNDLKRVIAYSTCSQLGYMVFAAGLFAYSTSMFHLATHALFKALLFLGAGAVIHALADEQDARRMGGLVRFLPLTYTVMFLGSLALMGFPYLAGFYSKDAILETAFGSYLYEGTFVFYLGTLAAFTTAFYSMRLLTLAFLRPVNGSRVILAGAHEPQIYMTLPLLVLSVGSIVGGYLLRDVIIGIGSPFWGNALSSSLTGTFGFEGEWISSLNKAIPLIFSFLGLLSATILYSKFFSGLVSLKLSFIGNLFYTFLNRKWLFDRFYTEWVSQPVLGFAYRQTYQNMDRGVLEFFGPEGSYVPLLLISRGLSRISPGFAYRLLYFMLASVVVCLIFIAFSEYIPALFEMVIFIIGLVSLFNVAFLAL